MKTKMVKEIMAPISEYTAISQEATLHEAILALKTCQEKSEPVILVHNGRQKLIGVITRLDVLRGLEHAYKEIGDLRHVSHSGFSPEFIKSLIKQYGFWQRPLGEICNKSVDTKIKDFMYTPDEGEFVDQDASLDEAIHQLIMGNHHNLLITRGLEIVGILRLRDMFNEIYRRTKACKT
jgi:CBS domain containing-hemolysin-like protein